MREGHLVNKLVIRFQFSYVMDIPEFIIATTLQKALNYKLLFTSTS